jgi:hypothetical protein
MKTMLLVVVLAAASCPGLLHATPASYGGSLHWTGGIGNPLIVNSVGEDAGWLSTDTTISWTVDNTTTPGLWHYEYTITVRDGGTLATDIQCVILETSSTFGWENLDSVGTTPADWLAGVTIDSFSRSKIQNLPSDVYGIMFCTAAVDPTTLTIRFDSDREPVWGDIYVRSFTYDGSYNTMHNAGWMWTDMDPNAPASSGSVENHLLVPDTGPGSDGRVPVPAAARLGALGVALSGWLQGRRRL